MKIVFLDAKTVGRVDNIDQLENLGNVSIYSTSNADNVAERIKDAEVVITNKVVLDKAVLSQATSLKLICIAATGMNNVDLEYARENDIAVKNAVDYSTKSVAQFTFNSLFFLLHNARYYDDYVKSKAYCNSDIFTNMDRSFWELNGKKFGIIGLGNIGKQVANIATCFGAKVQYYSTSGKNTDQPYSQLSFEELLSTSDVISIHSPLNENTKNLIGYEQMKQMKPTAYLLNMGRGGIINEKELAKALNENLIAGAAIDVMEKEPINANSPLYNINDPSRLYITPHIAWASIESRERLMDIVCEHIRDHRSN